MKRSVLFLGTILMVFVLSVGVSSLFTSCEGPAGPAGDMGADGTDGIDGIDGIDANETCKQCHNDESAVYAKMLQASNSGHQTGVTFERNGTSCAPCHTSDGFLEVLGTANMATAAAISDPTPVGCRTCHPIHENYTAADFALRTTDAVTAWFDNSITLDMGGNSNICANCHQPRVISPMPVSGGSGVAITSQRWGPHHGPQSTVGYGSDGFKIAGSTNYPVEGAATHYSAGCTSCHAADAFGAFAGGHSWSMDYEYHGSTEINVAGCNVCHSASPFDTDAVEAYMAGITTKFETLQTLLLNLGWIDASGYVQGDAGGNAGSSNARNLTDDEAGVLLAYRTILEDRSNGLHNPAFVNALLDNAAEVAATFK